jgi:hypothetical protein
MRARDAESLAVNLAVGRGCHFLVRLIQSYREGPT